MHIALFVLIVCGSTAIILYQTSVPKLDADTVDVSAPIPELARWHNP